MNEIELTTASEDTEAFDRPASPAELAAIAERLRARGCTASVVDDLEAARVAALALVPDGAGVYLGASVTLREAGIVEEVDESGRYRSLRREGRALDRVTQMGDIRRLLSAPDVVMGSVQAVTRDGVLVAASATGSQLAAHVFGAGRVVLVVGAQKVVDDVPAALRRIDRHCLPLEDARARAAYGGKEGSAVNRVLITNAEHEPGRTHVLLVAEPAGY